LLDPKVKKSKEKFSFVSKVGQSAVKGLD